MEIHYCLTPMAFEAWKELYYMLLRGRHALSLYPDLVTREHVDARGQLVASGAPWMKVLFYSWLCTRWKGLTSWKAKRAAKLLKQVFDDIWRELLRYSRLRRQDRERNAAARAMAARHIGAAYPAMLLASSVPSTLASSVWRTPHARAARNPMELRRSMEINHGLISSVFQRWKELHYILVRGRNSPSNYPGVGVPTPEQKAPQPVRTTPAVASEQCVRRAWSWPVASLVEAEHLEQ